MGGTAVSIDHTPNSLLQLYWEFGRYGNPWITSLIYVPYVLGVLLAARVQPHPADALAVVRLCAIFVPASAILHGAGCSWNDLVDEPLDRLVQRTRRRPLIRGAITRLHARLFTLAQISLWFGMLRLASPNVAPWGLPLVPAVMAYPYAKRTVPVPSMILGATLAYGLLIGYVAVLPIAGTPARMAAGLMCVAAAYTFFISAIDMIYAHQDLPDDLRAGIKSMAVTFRGAPKRALLALNLLQCGALLAAGHLLRLGRSYAAVAAGLGLVVNGAMVAHVDLRSAASCFWWFQAGAALSGICLVGGCAGELLADQ